MFADYMILCANGFCRSVVGFFGYKSSRAEALQSLAVSAASSNDPHAVFSG